MWKAFLDTLPRGYALEEQDWRRRHRIPLNLLAGHIPALVVIGGLLGHGIFALVAATAVPAVCALLGHRLRHHRRAAAVSVTLGLVYCSAALVGLTGGAIEAHFHFFIIIGFVALYEDWIPFLCMILFTTVSHVVGSYWQRDLIFDHASGQSSPWIWSLIHGVAVLVACVGIVLFWHVTEDVHEKSVLARRLADAEVSKQKFTHDLLVTLARRNQSMLYRQLEIINHLEDAERDPDTLAELFALDHLATRVRRNAESLLVLSGEKPPRIWSRPIPLRDVLRAAIAETEDLERVVVAADEMTTVPGHTVTDLTHLMAELTENAVRFSPPDTTVSIRVRSNRQDTGSQVLTVQDDGIGMSPDQLTSFNALLARPSQVDAAVSSRMGFHVVGRLAARHGITVSLSSTPGSGLTATIVLPPAMFAAPAQDETAPVPLPKSLFPASNPLGPEVPAPAPMMIPIPASALPAARDDRTRSAETATTAVGMPVACRQDKVLGIRPATVNALPSAVEAVPVEPRAGETAADNGVFSPAVPGPDQGGVPRPVPAASPLAAVAEDPFGYGHGQPAFESFGAVQPVAVGFGASDMFREHPMPAGAEQRWLGWWAAEVELASVESTALEPSELERSELGRSAFEPAVGPVESGPAGVESTMPAAAVDAGGSPEPAQPSRPAPSPFPVVPSPRPRGTTDPQLPPQSDRRAGSGTVLPPVGVPVDPDSGLRRRVPQSHLVPELREPLAGTEPMGQSLTEHASEAADALSRYQANRTSANRTVEEGQRWGT